MRRTRLVLALNFFLALFKQKELEPVLGIMVRFVSRIVVALAMVPHEGVRLVLDESALIAPRHPVYVAVRKS